jgi:uncharacterized small protein (DUF1192 family)
MIGSTWQERKAAGSILRHGLQGIKGTGTSVGSLGSPASTTTGWEPTCQCEMQGQGRCVILDPFMGAGTTALVALKHGRDYIGIELNAETIREAQSRIATVQPEIWTVEAQGAGKDTVA